jgi:hypothetical protein
MTHESRNVEGVIMGVREDFLTFAGTTARGISGDVEAEVVAVLIIHGRKPREGAETEKLDNPGETHKDGKLSSSQDAKPKLHKP